MKHLFQGMIMCMLVVLGSGHVQAEPVLEPPKKERCKVCGMYVTKYRPWLAQLRMQDDSVSFFDGVKDMLAYYFAPQKFGEKSTVKEIWVTDYYTQRWLDGTKAFFVIGSDVLGPMGHEFVPFDTLAAAENFKKDHKGKKIVRFEEISHDFVNRLRTGDGHSMHKMN